MDNATGEGALTITGVTMDEKFGEAYLDENGNVVFKLNEEFLKIAAGQTEYVEFTYTISDIWDRKDTATVKITVKGTEHGNDVFKGTPNDDDVSGGVGDDELGGSDGKDTLKGGEGNDDLEGGDDNDDLDGNEGTNTIDGGEGNDIIHSGEGNNTIDGGGGNKDMVDYSKAKSGVEVILEEEGSGSAKIGDDYTDTYKGGIEYVRGSSHKDIITANNKKNKLHGNDGDDTIDGRGGKDEIYGEGGNDNLKGGNNNDRIYGGNDNDEINGDDGNDNLYGGHSSDKEGQDNGADTFVLSKGDDTIHDFDHEEGDKLRISQNDFNADDFSHFYLEVGEGSITLLFEMSNGGEEHTLRLEGVINTNVDGDYNFSNIADLNTELERLLGYNDAPKLIDFY